MALWRHLERTARQTRARASVETRMFRAEIAGDRALADALFRHLWPGVLEIAEVEMSGAPTARRDPNGLGHTQVWL